MGNQLNRDYSCTNLLHYIKEGPLFISTQTLVWTPSEKQTLLDFLKFFENKELPWENCIELAWDRAKLALPKSNRIEEIHAYMEDPLNLDWAAFGSLRSRVRLAWAHFYALVGYLWSIHRGKSPLSYFQKTDIVYHLFLKEGNPDYEQIEIFLRALGKIKIILEDAPPTIVEKSKLIYAPCVLISGVILASSGEIKGYKILQEGVYITTSEVLISGVDWPNQELLILDSLKCGPLTLSEYLDELLYRTDLICRFLNKSENLHRR